VSIETITIRDAGPQDLPGMAAIYAVAAETSHATFDLEGRPLAWWQATLDACDESAGHLLVVGVDGDDVLGYAKSGRHKEKAAYDVTCETSVYVAESARGRGIGHALYAELLGRLERSPLRLAVAGIAQPNEPSERLHRAHGFVELGAFHGVGVKLGRAWDVKWFERPLG
jgi:phosphinothricin acetyltransferase